MGEHEKKQRDKKQFLKLTVDVINIDPMKNVLKSVADLLQQIKKSNFTDENGYKLTNNKSYIDTVGAIEELNKEN